MECSDRETRPSLTGTHDVIRDGVSSGSFSRPPSLYAVSFLFLAAVVVGFIWHDLRQAYQGTLAYWNARLSTSVDERVRIATLWLTQRRTDGEAVAQDPLTARLFFTGESRSEVKDTRRGVKLELERITSANGYLAGAV